MEEEMSDVDAAAELTGRELELADYFDRCAAEGDLAEFNFDERRRLDEFFRLWGIEPGERVLEPGCGSGRLTEELAAATGPGGEVLAMDLSAEMVARAVARKLPPHVIVLQGTVMKVPADDGFFDKVICLNVFPHFADRAAALAEFARLLREGGDLWINHFANRDAINEFHHGCDPAVRDHLIPPDEVVHRLLEQAGFAVVSHEDDDPGYRLHAIKG
jgi:demethylmenaquinone methyltransferase/2-methoxy-6-polyprenyl-1,4-benzoquinol methylase